MGPVSPTTSPLFAHLKMVSESFSKAIDKITGDDAADLQELRSLVIIKQLRISTNSSQTLWFPDNGCK